MPEAMYIILSLLMTLFAVLYPLLACGTQFGMVRKMNIFISGGCKNGKSTFAQDIAVRLANREPLYYIATMIPCDDEDRKRIERHIENRAGMGFETLEFGRNICPRKETTDPNATYLLDSVTALLLNEMFPSFHDSAPDPQACERCIKELVLLGKSAKNVIFVSDFIYSEADRYDPVTEEYRQNLATVDSALAAFCDTVVEVCTGNIFLHKGELPQ